MKVDDIPRGEFWEVCVCRAHGMHEAGTVHSEADEGALTRSRV